MRTKGTKNGVIGGNINQQEFEHLCEIFCSIEEIAYVFNVTYNTLQDWVRVTYGNGKNDTSISTKDVVERFRTKGKVSLRRNQYKQSEKFPVMAIWLGKQYLGQTDGQSDIAEQNQLVENASNILIQIKDKANKEEENDGNEQ